MVEETTAKVSTDALFDIQIKRIHEYKRQLLNIMGIIHCYNEMVRDDPRGARQGDRVCIFGGKAYATYLQAKRIVRLVTAVGDVVNNDPETSSRLSLSPTTTSPCRDPHPRLRALPAHLHRGYRGLRHSNKFQMNGCLIIGTLDGANVEFASASATRTSSSSASRSRAGACARTAAGKFVLPESFTAVMDCIKAGTRRAREFDELLWSLEGNEGFAAATFSSPRTSSLHRVPGEGGRGVPEPGEATESSIISTAFSGKFNSDRTIDQYAKEIWDIKPSVPKRRVALG